MQKKALTQYKKSKVSTTSRGRTLLMLYDGCIRFLEQARSAIDSGDTAARGNRINRAHAIVSELKSTLNHDVAPELCDNLDALYAFMLRELTDANRNSDVHKLDVVINLLDTLRAGWREAVAESEGRGVKKAAQAAPAGQKVADERGGGRRKGVVFTG